MPTPRINLLDMVLGLADTVDLVSPVLANHHQRVAYITLRLGLEMQLPEAELRDAVLAAALHDLGAVSLAERFEALPFDAIEPHGHAEAGYRLLRGFAPLAAAARLIRFHHVRWDQGAGEKRADKTVPRAAHLIHLADRIDTLSLGRYQDPAPCDRHPDPLAGTRQIVDQVRQQSGLMFHPDMVEAFESLAAREFFWLDLVSPHRAGAILRHVRPMAVDLTGRGAGLVGLVARVIDFRSPFTATHSAGVATTAHALAGLAGFTPAECENMRLAGYLHDLGKLVVPAEILEKPARLEQHEYRLIKTHTYHTYRVLEKYPALGPIPGWAAFHHERLDGQGYPFRLKGAQLSPGARIMAVADVFTALTEDRPYRAGMPRWGAIPVLQKMAGPALDPDIVALLAQNYEALDAVREQAQKEAAARYRAFRFAG